ncbi:putative copia-type polyprotein [Trifolium pratense]|uniref:Putative copia-type polyprotein n=2 Tax=Trifolium TaxID=3898 RepID=A0A2K3NXK0_TRIPR|nr:putative copia-type polyprotein [Trifolium pratense]
MASEGSSSGFVQPSIPKLDGHYDHWSMLMENFLRSKEYWGLIEEGIPEVRDEAALNEAQLKARNDLKLKDLKAKNYLYQAIDRVVLETILKKNTSKDIWDSLKKKYQGTSRVKRAQLQALRKEFEILHMKAGESVNEYFARTLTIANRMRIHGEKMEDVTIIEKILRSMTSKFDYVVCSIEESNDIDTMSVDELQSSLLVHEQRMSNHIEEEQALKVTHIENSSSRFRGRGGFRGRGRGRARGSFDKSSIECYNCHQNGHFQWECPGKTEGKANFVETDEEEILLMAYMDNKQAVNGEIWYLDSGCSNHMTGNKNLFCDLNESFRQNVKLGNDSSMSVMGKGSVKLLMNKKMQNINDVYYVPELKSNLISLGQLQETGCAILIQKGSCQIHDPKEGLVAEVKMSGNRMFQLKPESFDNQTCLKASISDPSWLWHYRFGHLNFNGLRVLQQKEMVKGLPQIETPSHVCEECLIAKQHRNSFPQESTWRASHVLQLVHSDICGPMNPTSNSNKRYFITFTDDFSRKTWVYFLKEKSEALEMFRKFKARVEKEKNQPIQCLRTDRGGEYTSSEFVNLCESNGIKRQLTAAYTPHQNGVSERRNITIMNMVRSMLTNKNVPKTFWPEAVNWSVHILNRCPTFSVKNMTPEEAWCGHKPAVDHFRVFGSIAYVHVPDQKRKKLDNKGEKCVLLGVSEESKAYRLYNPLTKKICISKDVVFDENNSWNWENLDKEKSVALELEDHESVEAENDAHGVREESNELESDHGSETAETSLQNMQRPRRKPGWMDDYTSGEEFSEEETLAHFALLAGSDPIAFDEAIKSSRWRKAMDAEIEAIEKNNTWELVELPKGEKAVGVKWIYKTKVNEKGEIDKFKARLVAKGYTQKYGIDYSEVFAPVARHDTIRMVIALAALNNWTVFQLDVKSAFLHGELVEQVFVEQPPGYVKKESKHMVYKLKRALYGLKQAPRAWYSRIDAYFSQTGFHKCPYEHTLYIKTGEKGNFLIVCLYVDDLIFTGNDECLFKEFKQSMMKEFEMTDLGMMKYFLGIEVVQSAAGIFICQKKYAQEVLERFKMDDCNPVQIPIVPGTKLTRDVEGTKIDNTYYKQMVGSLMYITATRPDLTYAVSLISRYMESPTELHHQVVKKILRYLKGTVNYGLFYKKSEINELVGFSDSDYAGDLDDRKSTSGYVFLLSGAAVSWSSKKQPVVTLSTTEAEFIAAASCVCQGIWLRRILEEVKHTQQGPLMLFCDNSSTIKLSKNPVLHGRSKHIDVRFHFLRDLTKEEVVKLCYCRSDEQIADIFTKPLKVDSFMKLRALLGMCSIEEIN